MIPCELCHMLIPAHMYSQHYRQCLIMHMMGEDDNEYDYDYDDNIVEYHIRSSHQLYRSNIRSFLETHHSPPSRRETRRYTPRVGQEYTYEDNMRFVDQMGKVEVGVQDIERISSISQLKDAEKDDAKCAICLEDLKDGITIRRLNSCQHIFCNTCINSWLAIAKTCPICKDDLDKN